MKAICITYDSHMWMLRGFFYQWNKYAYGLPITVAGYTKPSDELLQNHEFISIGNAEDYPAEKFSNGFIKLLSEHITDEYVMIFLEDFWLTREINVESVLIACDWLSGIDNALRFDLTGDRLYAGNMRDLEPRRFLDIIETTHKDSPYSLSFQTSIYNRELLLRSLIVGETPWEIEMTGSWRVNELGFRIFGSRQWPVRYQMVHQKGEFSLGTTSDYIKVLFSDDDIKDLKNEGLDKKPGE